MNAMRAEEFVYTTALLLVFLKQRRSLWRARSLGDFVTRNCNKNVI